MHVSVFLSQGRGGHYFSLFRGSGIYLGGRAKMKMKRFLTFLNQGQQILMRAPKLLRLWARLAHDTRTLIFTPVKSFFFDLAVFEINFLECQPSRLMHVKKHQP